MLNPDIDSLFNVTVTNPLVDDDTHSRFCDVVYDAGLAMIYFVWHAKRC